MLPHDGIKEIVREVEIVIALADNIEVPTAGHGKRRLVHHKICDGMKDEAGFMIVNVDADPII